MISGYATWQDLAGATANVLLVVNSRPGEIGQLGLAVEALERSVSLKNLHVVADLGRKDWLRRRGIPSPRILLARDHRGDELELNYFLETPAAVRWILARGFGLVVGSAAHNLYNEEVKDILERRVAVFLGDGRFVAHALPEKHLFLLDERSLYERAGRQKKIDVYRELSRAIIEDFHRLWVAQGSPAVSDEPDYAEEERIFARHLGAGVLAFDESSAIPIRPADLTESVADLASFAQSVLRAAISQR